MFNDNDKTKSKLVLLIRKDEDGSLRYSLTNSRKHLPKLAFMQVQRYFVERAFQDAKQQMGLNQYQLRKYDLWYRHITMNMLGMQFITEEKTRQKSVEKYYTTADIVTLLTQLLHKKEITFEEQEKSINLKN